MFTHEFVDWIPIRETTVKSHPTPVCESQSLNSINHPTLNYKLSLDEGIKQNLSTLQEETVALICQAFKSNKAFLIGDATGMGKGRIIAASLIELSQTHKAKGIWVSINKNLQKDAERDMSALGDFHFGNLEENTDFYFTSYSVIRHNENLVKMIKKVSDADIEDGGSGAFYIYLKKKFKE